MPKRDDPVPCTVGSEFTVADTLREGDLAFFEATADRQCRLHKLPLRRLAGFEGMVLKLERGATPEQGVLRTLSDDEVEELRRRMH
jgi:hypothetical protein